MQSKLTSRLRRSETPNAARDHREVGRLPSNGWSTPLWDHALPAWSAGAKIQEAVGYVELAQRREAVRRWRGLPPEAGD
jgi:hypothetical protein